MPEKTEHRSDQPGTYEIVVDGLLDASWPERIGPGFGMKGIGNRTVLTGPIIDQSSLHGILRKIRNIGIPLVSVRRLDDEGE